MKFSNVYKKFQSSLRENKTVFLLCAILIICVIISLAVIMGRKKSAPGNGRYARIYQNGTIIRTIDLSAVEEPYQFTICGADGEENTIEVKNGEIGMISANCRDQICVKMGFIHSAAMPVTCLPNHIVIEVGSSSEENEPDGVAY